MYQNKKVIITICARGGSKGIPGKNIQPLLGKPLITYTLKQAKLLSWADRIIVSTDSEEIKRLAESYHIKSPFLRPKYLASDSASKFLTVKHAVHKAQQLWQETYDVAIDLDVTSPLRSQQDIESCLKMLVTIPRTKVVYSVTVAERNPYFNLVEPDNSNYVKISKQTKKIIKRRQDAPTVYAMNASIYAIWVKHLFSENSYHTDQTRAYIMPEERSIDIDRPIDLELVALFLKRRL